MMAAQLIVLWMLLQCSEYRQAISDYGFYHTFADGAGEFSCIMSLLNSVRMISVINSFTQRDNIVIDWVNRSNSIPYQIEIEV